MKKVYLYVAAIVLFSLLAACSQEDQKDDEKEVIPSVETDEVTEGDLVTEKSIYGRTSPVRSTPIMLQNPGEIDNLKVSEGEQVEKNDLLATITTPGGNQNIYAPKAGKIVNIQSSEGETVTSEEPFAIVADLEKLKIKLDVTAEISSLLKQGEKEKAIINDDSYDAEITTIATMPNDTGLYTVEAVFENKEGKIIPGTVAKVNIPVSTVKKALIIPTAAIVDENDESFVYIIKDNKATKTKITIKETQSEQTAIEGELKKGDEIVVSGQLTLTDGNKVNIVKGE